MDQQITIDLVEKHAIACKEQLCVESCDTNLKFYDQQKVMQEFIRIYSASLLGNHIAGNESIPKKEKTEEEISQLTSEWENMIETSKSNRDLIKIHFKVLEDFEKMNKSETMIKTIRDVEAIENENNELKKHLSDLENEKFNTKIRSLHDKNDSLKKELAALEQKLKTQHEAKQMSKSNSKMHTLVDAFA